MRFGGAVMDVVGANARTAGSGKAAERAAADQQGPSFDGVLAEAAGRDGKPTGRSDAKSVDKADAQVGTTGAPAGDRPQGGGASPLPTDLSQPQPEALMTLSLNAPRSGVIAPSSPSVSRAGAAAAPPIVSGFPAALAPALAGLLGAGASQDATGGIDDEGPAKTPPSAAPGAAASTGSAPLDALIEQMTPQDGIKRPDEPAGVGPSVPSPPPDLLMLLAGASAKAATAPTPATADKAQATSAATVLQSADRRVTGRPDAMPAAADESTPASADAKTNLAGIAVETHLAPVATTAGRDTPADRQPSSGGAPQVPDLPKTSSATVVEAPASSRADPAEPLPTRRAADPSAPTVGTALPPAAPVRSIAGAIVELASRAAPAADPTLPASTPAPIARTLTLQLSPADLGTVDIRMHMSGRDLDVQLSISDSTTLGLVSRDRDALASALHDSSYALHSLVIQDGAGSATPGGHHDNSGGTSGGEARPDRSGEDAGSGQRGAGGRGQGSGSSPKPSPDRRDMAASVDRRGTLFI